MKKNSEKDIYRVPTITLFCLGIMDIIRGFMHTFNVSWAADFFAKLDLTVARDVQLMLLGTFGISNLLTGLIYFVVCKKAKQVTPYILTSIPISYSVGVIGLKVAKVNLNAASFNGKYMMAIYLGICTIVAVRFFIENKKTSKNTNE